MHPKIKWTSAVIAVDRYKTQIFTDSHTLISDEPETLGGKNLGPAPGDFLRMSLASCTAITLRMYADRKEIAVEKIEVKVGTESLKGKTVFHRKIMITGVLNSAQQKRMLQIANACPIHKVLAHPIEFTTEITTS
jgi:putative redox protein